LTTFERFDIIYGTMTPEAEKIGRKLDRSKSEPIYKSARFPEHKIISIPNHKTIKRFIKEQILNDLEEDLDAWEELLKGGI